MSDIKDTSSGYGHFVEIKLPNGNTVSVPWGFSDPKKEAAAAKKHKIEVPGTSVVNEPQGTESA